MTGLAIVEGASGGPAAPPLHTTAAGPMDRLSEHPDLLACRRACEAACQTLTEACAAAADVLLRDHEVDSDSASSALMDCWYLAGALGRLLSRSADYDARYLAMLVEASEHVSSRAAARRLPDPPPALRAWTDAARGCANACGALRRRMAELGAAPADERAPPGATSRRARAATSQ